MENIMEFIIQEALILIPALFVIGLIIKNTKLIEDRFIPLIMLLLGVVGAVALLGMSAQSVIQGILVAGATVFVHQLYKQSKE